MSFRVKIFVIQLVLFFVFLLLLFPFLKFLSEKLVEDTLLQITESLIERVEKANSEDEMVEIIQNEQAIVFYKITLTDQQGRLLYDTYFNQTSEGRKVLSELHKLPIEEEDVLVAKISHQEFAYVSKDFDFHGKTYILRTSFPYRMIEEVNKFFTIGFIFFGTILFVLFAIITWLVFYRLTQPIQKIINTIKPYRYGLYEYIPQIDLEDSFEKKSDLHLLASILNSLSERVKMQIQNLTEERNEKEAILESLLEGVLAIDHDFRVKYVNFMGSKMLGIPKRYLHGKKLPEQMKQAQKILLKKCRELLQECQNRETVVTDSVFLEDKAKVYIDLIASPISGRRGAIIVMQDKSSHYKVLEIGKDFVANASHELRTPITIIKGFAETLQDLPQITPQMLKEITEKIVRNCERMEKLVRNLLTLADIENLPESRFQDCDIILLIEKVEQMLLYLYPNATISFTNKIDSLVLKADSDLLELALANIFHNAAKYSKGSAKITVSVELIGEEVKIVICDQGIGIPEADLEHIFDRFYTVDKTHSRRLGGAGLGLSIVKNIIQKHDGMISVTSKVGVGTCFTIFLPLRKSTIS